MGSFANSVFSVLLGWIRTTVNELWSMLSSGEGGGMLAWIGENWKALTLMLCLVGIVVDALVHVIRWRPLQVWASFFRRIRGKGQEADEWVEPEPQTAPPPAGHFASSRQQTGRAWVYPDGTARFDQDYEPPRGEVVAFRNPPENVPEDSRANRNSDYYQRFARPVEEPVRFGGLGRSYRRPRASQNRRAAAAARFFSPVGRKRRLALTRSPSPWFSSRVRVSARVMDCITIRRSW